MSIKFDNIRTICTLCEKNIAKYYRFKDGVFIGLCEECYQKEESNVKKRNR